MAPGLSPLAERADKALSVLPCRVTKISPDRRPPSWRNHFKCLAAGPDVLAPAPPQTMHRKGAAEQTPSIRLPRSIPLCDTRSFANLRRLWRLELPRTCRKDSKNTHDLRSANQINSGGGPAGMGRPARRVDRREPMDEGAPVFRLQWRKRIKHNRFRLERTCRRHARPDAAEANKTQPPA
jgi:hypothetical protein